MKTLYARAFRSSLFGALILAALMFLTAGTIRYWQAWVFLAVFVGASGVITVYLAMYDPALLERRMKAGPAAEKEKLQKVIISLAMIGFVALVAIPGLDYRWGWSRVPPFVSLVGDATVAIGFLIVFFVLKVNTYSASTVQVTEGQQVVTTGPYARVRHPMYAGALPLIAGIPLALGSWWGLAALIVVVPSLIWRLLDEERFLRENLRGYTEYTHKVQFRLVPGVW